MKKLLLIFLFTPLLLFSSANDRALYIKKYSKENKVALVIGNAKYQYFSKLKNSKNDAYDMQKVLKKQGFEVLFLQDGNLREMKKIVRKFTKKLRNGGVGFFFYAGHGLEVEGQNYLIPVGANIPEKDEVAYESLAMNMVIDKMENSGNRLNIVVLDACRNDPFSRSGGGGLAQINNAKGMYISYATAPGSVASDGSGRNGLFTKHLIKNIKKPNITLDTVFNNTRKDVYEESNDKQLPWTSSSVIGDFYFKVDNSITYEQPSKNIEPQKQSSFSFKTNRPKQYELTINTIPKNAKITIKNSFNNYHKRMLLNQGKYDVEVSKSGYHTKSGTIDLQSNLNIDIVLEKKVVKESSLNLLGKWSLNWKGAMNNYTGYLNITKKKNSKHYLGRLHLEYGNNKSVDQDASIKINKDSITVNCSNPSRSSWSPDNFYLTIKNNKLEGYSVDSSGNRGRKIILWR
jgi:hypothetical protein